MKEVWVFNGAGGRFPSAVFEGRAEAQDWITKNALTGVLTKYPVGISVYEWAQENGQFSVMKEQQTSSAFIQNFSSAAQEHVHFENGIAQ